MSASTSNIDASLRPHRFTWCLVEPPVEAVQGRDLPRPRLPLDQQALTEEMEDLAADPNERKQLLAQQIVPTACVYSQDDDMEVSEDDEEHPATVTTRPQQPIWPRPREDLQQAVGSRRAFSGPGPSSSAMGEASSSTGRAHSGRAAISETTVRTSVQVQVTDDPYLLVHIGNFRGPRRVDVIRRQRAPYATPQDGVTIRRPRAPLIAFLKRMRLQSGAAPAGSTPNTLSNEWASHWRQSAEWTRFIDAMTRCLLLHLIGRGSADAWRSNAARWWHEFVSGFAEELGISAFEEEWRPLLAYDTITFNITKTHATADTLFMNYPFNFGGSQHRKSVAMGALPADFPIPSLDQLRHTYELDVTINESHAGATEAQKDMGARLLLAFWAGPLNHARSQGADMATAGADIEADFDALKSIILPTGTSRGVSVAVWSEANAWHVRMRYRNAQGNIVAHSAKYPNEARARADAELLKAMVADVEWGWCEPYVIWLSWLFSVFGRDQAEEWLRGNVTVDGLKGLVLRRARMKSCCAAGLVGGCYRERYGQVCVPHKRPDWLPRVSAAIAQDQDVAATLGRGGRVHRVDCGDMAKPILCHTHFIREKAADCEQVRALRLMVERADPRLPVIPNLVDEPVPVVDPVLGSYGVDIGPAVCAFLASLDSGPDSLATRAARALGIIPSWACLAAVETGLAPLISPRVAQILDRVSMLATSRASLDRVFPAVRLGDGTVVAHHPINLRLVDWARNRARMLMTILCSDALEAAIVIHNFVRVVLGSQRADPLMDQLRARLEELWARERHFVGPRRNDRLVEWAQEEWGDAMEEDEVWDILDGLPQQSLADVRAAVNAACRDLTAPPGAPAAAAPAAAAAAPPAPAPAPAPAAPVAAPGAQDGDDDAGSEDGSEDGDPVADAEAEAMEDDDDGGADGTGQPRPPRVKTRYSAAQKAGLVSVIGELEAEYGIVLDKGSASNELPHLFMPASWSDDQRLAYAEETNEQANVCDAAGLQPPHRLPPPGHGGTDFDDYDEFDYGAFCRRNRSPATLLLFWCREWLKKRLRRCPLTDVDLRFRRINSRGPSDPCVASLAPHATHNMPVSYGYNSPWPTSLDQYDEALENVTYSSWFANTWLGSWRTPGLGTTGLRRIEWYIVHGAEYLGLDQLTAQEAEQLKAHCGQHGVTFPAYPAAQRNAVSPGEQIALIRRLLTPGSRTEELLRAGAQA